MRRVEVRQKEILRGRNLPALASEFRRQNPPQRYDSTEYVVDTTPMTPPPPSLPFRFKAGPAMAPMPEVHHHRNSTKSSHKPFKSRHATKSLIKELAKGKTAGIEKKSRKTPHQQVMSKFDRRNHAKQIRQVKHEQNVKSTSVFAGQNGAPRVVAVVPLCTDCDAMRAVIKLGDGEGADLVGSREGHMRVRVDRFKQNLLYVPVERSLLPALDACRVADFVVFLLSPMEEPDEQGELLLRTIEGQGVSNALVMVQGLDGIEAPKKRPQVVASLKTYITHFFPNQEKVLSLDSESECANAVRSLCTITPKGVKWREDRSWMLVEDVRWPETGNDSGGMQNEVVLTGVVRGRGLKANRLVQVGDWGHYQIEKVTDATLPESRKRKANEMAIDQEPQSVFVLEAPNSEQEDLAELAPYEAEMEDVDTFSVSQTPTERRGVLLDDHHYFSDGETNLPEAPKRLPKGTSSYQSAWFLGDMSDSGSDYEDVEGEGDVEMDFLALPEDGIEGTTHPDSTEANPSEYPQSEMFLDPSPSDEATQLAEYRANRKTEAKDDLEFPDEIELHPNVLARERLAKYRGLKSLKTSHWETSEDKSYEPEDWPRLLPIPDYKKARKSAEYEALAGGIPAGTRVHVHLRNVPLSIKQTYNPNNPLALHSLLLHEQKRSVIHVSITLSSTSPTPLRSKDPLLLQLGPRRFAINPLFSVLGNTPNNVHKYLRYLHPSQTAVASFIAPVTWGAVPALFFLPPTTSNTTSLSLIATGTLLPPTPTRIIAKRALLTGHPYKIHKKLVTVRYMFFNADDVAWFKALRLWTKRGRQGFIKESLGTHGYFKAEFDGRVSPQDGVGVSLFKRVWPREAGGWVLEGGGMGLGGREVL